MGGVTNDEQDAKNLRYQYIKTLSQLRRFGAILLLKTQNASLIIQI